VGNVEREDTYGDWGYPSLTYNRISLKKRRLLAGREIAEPHAIRVNQSEAKKFCISRELTGRERTPVSQV